MDPRVLDPVSVDLAQPEELVIRSDGTVDGLPFHTTAWDLSFSY
jgi:hypothetical protein